MPRSQTSGSRPRPRRACTDCARRKLSCDKRRPSCGRCARAGLHCVYLDRTLSSSQSLPFIDETQRVITRQAAVSSRISRLGQMIVSASDTADQSESPEAGGEYLASFPGHLYRGTQARSMYLSPTAFALISDEITAINDMLREQQSYSVEWTPSPSALISSESDGTPLSQRSARIGPKPSYGDIFPHVPQWPSEDERDETAPQYGSEIVTLLPFKEQREMLVWSYMSAYHTMKPLFSGSSFLKQFDEFQNWTDGSNPEYHLGSHFLALLTAVIFAGCVVCSRGRLESMFGKISREALSSRLYHASISAIRQTGFPQTPSLQTFAAFVISSTTWLREEQPLSCCSFVGVAFRVAQMLGLHKEPSNFADLSITEVHVRRLAWWTLVAVDAQVAFASGLPPVIGCQLYDVRLVDDLNVSPSDPNILSSSSISQGGSVLGHFVTGKFNFYKNASGLLHLLHNTTLSKADVDAILAIAKHIREDVTNRRRAITDIERSLTNHLSPTPASEREGALGRAESNLVFAQFSKMLLSLFSAKPFAIMYGPLHRHGLLSYLYERQPDYISFCKEYLYRFILLTQCHEFQPWHWCWPGQHQPLHSIMALIADLDKFPSAPEAKETRKLIDLALLLSDGGLGENGIVSSENGRATPRPLNEGGDKAWWFIKRARARCWERAGLDTNVLICPKTAKDIHLPSISGRFSDDYSLSDISSYGNNTSGETSQASEDWSYSAHDQDMLWWSGLTDWSGLGDWEGLGDIEP